MLNKWLLWVFLFIGVFAFCLLKNKNMFLPGYIPHPVYHVPENPLENDTVQLGRLLFYDNILSVNNQVSCASCHSPYNAFAHTDHALSHGVFDSIGTRNAPALFNLAWHKEFMWDGATHHIEAQVLAPLHDPRELGSSIEELIKKLRASTFYQNEFFAVYGDSLINSSRVLKSIAAFELSLVSFGSKYDMVQVGKAGFTTQEQKGYALFQEHCNQCHVEPLFSNFKYRDNGLQVDSILQDFGRFLITGEQQDKYRFKTPSLRNLSYTFPYMHDGRFDKLRQVLNHYENIAYSRSVDVKSIPLSFNEQSDLIAFMLTLNDKEFVFNQANSFPNKLREYLPED